MILNISYLDHAFNEGFRSRDHTTGGPTEKRLITIKQKEVGKDMVLMYQTRQQPWELQMELGRRISRGRFGRQYQMVDRPELWTNSNG